MHDHPKMEVTDTQISSLDNRVTGLERDVHNLSTAVLNLAKDQKESFVEVRKELTHISEDSARGKRTDWSVIIAWMAVCITLVAGIGGLSLSPVIRDLTSLENEFRAHEQLDTHPVTGAKIEAVDALTNVRINELDRRHTALELRVDRWIEQKYLPNKETVP